MVELLTDVREHDYPQLRRKDALLALAAVGNAPSNETAILIVAQQAVTTACGPSVEDVVIPCGEWRSYFPHVVR